MPARTPVVNPGLHFVAGPRRCVPLPVPANDPRCTVQPKSIHLVAPTNLPKLASVTPVRFVNLVGAAGVATISDGMIVTVRFHLPDDTRDKRTPWLASSIAPIRIRVLIPLAAV